MVKILVIRVKEKGGQEKSYEYKNSVVLNDPNLLALVLQDLVELFGCPIDKAVAIMRKSKEKLFPFS